LLLLAVFASAKGAEAEVIAFVGATIHPVSGPVVPSGVMVIEGDTILALGEGVEIPEGAKVVSLEGKHLYPAFVHPGTVLGLVEIGAVRATNDTNEAGDFNPELRAEVAFNGDSMLLPPTLAGGVVLAHVMPQGGLLTGTSALMRLEGWNWRDLTVAAPIALHLRFPGLPAAGSPGDGKADERRKQKKKRQKQLDEMDALFSDARAYGAARRAAEANKVPGPATDPKLEALQPLLQGELPLFLHANEKRQILQALDFAREQEISQPVLVAGPDAAEVTDRLREDDVSVILNGVLRLPSRGWQAYDAPLTAARRLFEAGIPFAIGDGGNRFQAANARNLPFHAAAAAAHGLPREEALASITLRPAEILGAADRFGSLEPGKEASFLVTDGDPLEITTRIEEVWNAGSPIDSSRNRQLRLYERYRSRPERVTETQ